MCSTLAVGFGALICIFLRIFGLLDQKTSFFYMLLATSNSMFGLCALLFYLLHKINAALLHNLLFNLWIGLILFADILFFDRLFKKR